jgi:hypothetical protein
MRKRGYTAAKTRGAPSLRASRLAGQQPRCVGEVAPSLLRVERGRTRQLEHGEQGGDPDRLEDSPPRDRAESEVHRRDDPPPPEGDEHLEVAHEADRDRGGGDGAGGDDASQPRSKAART